MEANQSTPLSPASFSSLEPRNTAHQTKTNPSSSPNQSPYIKPTCKSSERENMAARSEKMVVKSESRFYAGFDRRVQGRRFCLYIPPVQRIGHHRLLQLFAANGNAAAIVALRFWFVRSMLLIMFYVGLLTFLQIFGLNTTAVMSRIKLNRRKKQKKLAALCALWLHILNMVHKNAAKWRGKKFPHYWDLCIVFGKDRANGRDAQTAADIISDINREEPEATVDGLDDMDVNQPLKSPSDVASREESRKRKRRNSWDPLMNSLKESAEIIGAEIREATNTFNRVFGTESNREELRNNLFAEMNKVEGLTIRECDKAVCKLAQNEELMVIFFKVDEERKLGWVKNMLTDTA
ncbi:hypothetical protein L1987_06238 [Smallanthus sonchifolius]|uniref:Uncharacterized protein n=1 Tax=Smallanthus sonchifolius TaxID=185202 RepID=A0ACB9JXN4_9ASTR|nr:hypothetical protein L1987_06238 [Smallanthus sonchifolius]